MVLATTLALADQPCAISFRREVTLQGTEVWRQFLPSLDARWPALELIVEPTEPHPGVVTGWDIELVGLGEADLFYPKTPDFHGPGPLAIGAWLLNAPRHPLVLRDKRFQVRVDVKDLIGVPYVLKPGDPEWLQGMTEMTRAHIMINLDWYVGGRQAKGVQCGAATDEPSP